MFMINDILVNHHLKVTKPRLILLDFILKKQTFSHKDLNIFTQFDKSTIYRVLAIFEEKGIIYKKIINHQLLYCFKQDHLHYLECVKCKKKEVLEECPYTQFDLKGYSIIKNEPIKGICPKCQMERIGLFTGSFNPPTKAHYEIGKILLEKNIVDRVIYVPCNNIAKKNLPTLRERSEMLELMLNNESQMILDKYKLKSTKKDFNYQDLSYLKEKYLTSKFYIIIGDDLLNDMSNWLYLDDIINNNYFIVIKRLNNNYDTFFKEHSKYKEHFIFIEYDNKISSTLVRQYLHSSKNVNKMLALPIINYINKHQLYQ